MAALLARCGAGVVDTDAIAHELTRPGGAAIDALRAEFGADAIAADGSLDRVHMRALVFAERAARQRLEAILHPLIGAETEHRAAALEVPAIVFDVPLLVESGRWRARVQRVLVVDCSEATQVQRVVARSGWTPEAVAAVIAQQAPRALRRACADAVIFNDGLAPEQLAAEVTALWEHWGASRV